MFINLTQIVQKSLFINCSFLDVKKYVKYKYIDQHTIDALEV